MTTFYITEIVDDDYVYDVKAYNTFAEAIDNVDSLKEECKWLCDDITKCHFEITKGKFQFGCKDLISAEWRLPGAEALYRSGRYTHVYTVDDIDLKLAKGATD
jgi:hypothetical protein